MSKSLDQICFKFNTDKRHFSENFKIVSTFNLENFHTQKQENLKRKFTNLKINPYVGKSKLVGHHSKHFKNRIP